MTNTTTRRSKGQVRLTTRSSAPRRRMLLVAGATTLAVCGTAVGTSVATSADAPSRPLPVAPHAPDRWGGPDVQERDGVAAEQAEPTRLGERARRVLVRKMSAAATAQDRARQAPHP